jgi:cytidylate kinase
MKDQIIISIGREYGSAGHKIAEKLAKKLDIPLYDRNILEELSHTKEVDVSHYEQFDEKPRNFFLSRTVKGHSNSPEENVAELQFALLKSKAVDGDSFVVVGRCADYVLRDFPGLVSIFVHSEDMEEKINYIMNLLNIKRKDAIKAIEQKDKKRANYYQHFAKGKKWGACKSYDICINSSLLGIDASVDFLFNFIQKFMES